MWLWRCANVYWLVLIGFTAWVLFTYDFGDEIALNNVTAVIILLAMFVLIATFQFAWGMWLWGNKHNSQNKAK
jgi:hypothetical protein